MRIRVSLAQLFACPVAVLRSWQAPAAPVQITIRNLAVTNGKSVTPVWVGFHNRSFAAKDQKLAADSSVAVSNGSRGENSRSPLRHDAVARGLKEIGVVTKGRPFPAADPVVEDGGNKRWIAFVQERGQASILGIASSFDMEAK